MITSPMAFIVAFYDSKEFCGFLVENSAVAGEFQLVLPSSPGEPRAATCVIPFSKGFIIGGDDGRIRIYEKSDEPKELYRNGKTLQVEPTSGAAVRSLALSPSEELLGVSTSSAQLYQLSLLGQDLLKAEDGARNRWKIDELWTKMHGNAQETPAFEPVLSHFHTGAGLDSSKSNWSRARCHFGAGCMHPEAPGALASHVLSLVQP